MNQKTNSNSINRSRLRWPYPNGKPVECPACKEHFELKRISELNGTFWCNKCEEKFSVKNISI